MTRSCFLVIVYAFIPLSLIGQSTTFDFPITYLGEELGLQSLLTNAVAKDTSDVLWIGTSESVYRFEGNKFTRLNIILGGNQLDFPILVNNLYVDASNNLWIGTMTFGVFKYDIDRNKLTRFTGELENGEVLGTNRIYGLHTLNDSIFRMTLHDSGPVDFYLEKDSFDIVEVYRDSAELIAKDGFQLMVKPVFDKERNHLKNWYCSLGGMNEYLPERDTFLLYTPEGYDQIKIRNAIFDKDSLIWCATYMEGLWSFNTKDKSWQEYRCAKGPNSYINCFNSATLAEYDDDHLIVGGYYDGYLFNKRTAEFTMLVDVIPYGTWNATAEDMLWIDSTLWISSYGSGLIKHEATNHWKKNIYTGKYVATARYNDKHNKYYTAYDNHTFGVYGDEGFRLIDLSDQLDNSRGIEIMYWDEYDRIWFGLFHDLYYYDYNRSQLVGPMDHVIPKKYSQHMHYKNIIPDNNGHLWLSSYEGSAVKIDLNTLESTTYSDAGNGDVTIPFAYRSEVQQATKDGKVWFRAQNNFFYYDNETEEFSFAKDLMDESGGLFTMPVSPNLAVSENGGVYFATRTNEIYRISNGPLEGQKCYKLPYKKEPASYRIRDMTIDTAGRIWMSTSDGLSLYNTSDSTFTFFGDDEGFNNLSYLTFKNEGELIAYSDNMFHVINCKNAVNLPEKHNLRIVSISKDGQALTTSEFNEFKTSRTIKFNPSNKFLRLTINDYCYASKYDKSYAYKIKGDDVDWKYIGQRQDLTLTDLPRGNHELMFKSKLKYEDDWSKPIVLAKLAITPPLLKRVEFWIVIGVLLSLLGFLAYRYRMRQLQEKQNLIIAFNKQIAETEMKALRAQMNPHFLFNVLNAIKLNVQKNNQEEAITFITDFSKLIRSVLQNSGKPTISLRDELEALELYIKIEKKRFDSSINYSINIDNKISLDQIKIPPMLLQPYVENSIWHGILHKTEEKGEININVDKVDNNIIIAIKDNGIGREKANQLKLKSAQRKKSMGMQITQDRMNISNQISDNTFTVKIIDLYHNDGLPAGTEAIITIGTQRDQDLTF